MSGCLGLLVVDSGQLPQPQVAISGPGFVPTGGEIDPTWAPFSKYLESMEAKIKKEWNRILDGSKVQPPIGTYVAIRFRMNAKGRITRILAVENTSDEFGKDACLSALTNISPYRTWTPAMIAKLGDQQDMTFTFYYVGQ
jgi:hypothetical protein